MEGIHNLKAEKVINAFERAGWTVRNQTGSHAVLKKEGNPCILTIPVHKGKPIKRGLLLAQIKKAGLTEEGFLEFYK